MQTSARALITSYKKSDYRTCYSYNHRPGTIARSIYYIKTDDLLLFCLATTNHRRPDKYFKILTDLIQHAFPSIKIHFNDYALLRTTPNFIAIANG